MKLSSVMYVPEVYLATFLKLSALIAEDNEINVLILKNILLNVGLNVDVVEDGIQAVEAAKHRNYDIIFMDINMPLMDGIEAASIILRHKAIPIIAVTTCSGSEVKEACKVAGMVGFISKPLKVSEIHGELIRFLCNPCLEG